MRPPAVLATAAAMAAVAAHIPIASAAPFGSCAEAINAGAAPLYVGDPGYSRKLDRDGDGIACEAGSTSGPSSPAKPAGETCANYARFIFRTTPDGKTQACVYRPPNGPGMWVSSAPLVGTRAIGTDCTPSTAAQTGDGAPLVCVSDASGSGNNWQPGP
jgi:Excalibur calcium-binding domain